MIRNIELSHAGKYICVVDTDVESLSAVAVLVVKGTPTVSPAAVSPITCELWGTLGPQPGVTLQMVNGALF